MSDELFSLSNRIALARIAQGKPGTEELFALFRDRDIELIEKMAVFGGPLSVGAGSAIPHEGDVVITTNQNLSGVHYYNSLTINAGVIVTANKPLMIKARSFIYMPGATITSVGMGAPGGLSTASAGASPPGSNGYAGVGGGGGKNNDNKAGGIGGGFVFGDITIAGGASETAGQVLSSEAKYLLMMYAGILGGYWGGCGGGSGAWSSSPGGNGGAGGGVISMAAPVITATGGTISSNGAAGLNSGGDGGGGGGGGGCAFIDTKSLIGGSITAYGGLGGAVVTGSAGDTSGAQGGTGIVQINIY